MIELKYFCLEDKSLYFDVIKELMKDDFKQNYTQLKGEQIDIQIFFLKESDQPFKTHKNIYALLEKEGKEILPIITLNNIIIKKRALLSNKEIEAIFDIGVAVQDD